MSQQASRISALIEPSLTALGYELVGVEYMPQGKHSLLRIYIDHENGIDVDDCQQASQQISGVMDVEDPLKGQYTLEVSSPGLDRPLFKAAHYERFVGEIVELRLHSAIEGRRRFTGTIAGVENEIVLLELDDGQQIELPLAGIEKANLKPEW